MLGSDCYHQRGVRRFVHKIQGKDSSNRGTLTTSPGITAIQALPLKFHLPIAAGGEAPDEGYKISTDGISENSDIDVIF